MVSNGELYKSYRSRFKTGLSAHPFISKEKVLSVRSVNPTTRVNKASILGGSK
ncbi:hypothetical protein AXFE_24590 [Acidithrix ferrooxidans]|uniref:Uncharacterized protein n=1 Tax=Acidithrix ferrooxidans TaxID=1280514 RepID=A0A0D8HFM3_9ACTN|nr:hypothetical protein AXFE_24590 [Acidithrix ferrooxidans]